MSERYTKEDEMKMYNEFLKENGINKRIEDITLDSPEFRKLSQLSTTEEKKRKKKNTIDDFKDGIEDFFDMVWEGIKALVSPALGCLTVLAIPAVIATVVSLCAPWFETLSKGAQNGIWIGLIVLALIGGNIANYCHVYINYAKPKWCFWGGILISIIGGALAISSIVG